MSGATVLEEIIDLLYGSEAGKVMLVFERYADGLEARLRVYSGGAPMYGGYVESRGFATNDLLMDRDPKQQFSPIGEMIRHEVERLGDAIKRGAHEPA